MAVRNGSVATWQHINLHGEYYFSDEKLQDSIGLYAPQILAMQANKMGGPFCSNRLIINGFNHSLLRFWYVCLI